jgi:hypothetical protein
MKKGLMKAFDIFGKLSAVGLVGLIATGVILLTIETFKGLM